MCRRRCRIPAKGDLLVHRNWIALLLLACSLATSGAADMPDLKKTPLPTTLLAPEAKLAVAAGICFLEGPAVDAAGSVFFSDIQGSRILKMDKSGSVTTFREDSGRTNGNTFDSQGRLISCEGTENGPGGRRRIVRTDMRTGKVEVLLARYEGSRYNM